MKKQFCCTLASFLFLSTVSLDLHAEASHVSVMPTFIGADQDRGTDESGFGVRAIYGWKINERWDWEAQFFYNVLETDESDLTDFYQAGLGLDFRYNFTSDYGATPYLLVGLGAVHNDVVPNRDDDTSAFANLGGGLVFKEIANTRLQIRTEFRVLYDSFQEDYLDWQFGLGFEFPFR
ncbi:outer membrane beta-barrel protein [Gallaecimonas xiamenensis]|uniref:OmpA family protein n=1 Tax=Gallaecimonas xiamenensis 3-C-1 TaxID=745411 RepID=K2JP01_9GAMM|nr:outer membrane beta-barrel protein [Gallaecimonas xiamenensis]EKE76247.1 OmpA family protein [Gallaecimonas xiamenensis 3-C-1]